jgi:NAD(P)-dependent dehydrogenase (short-subunit alcohol dehydrogenase family)
MTMPGQPSLALVTGAAHRLGKGIAMGLARAGYAIGMHYHQSDQSARQTEAEIAALGVPVIPLRADLTDETQINALFTEVDRHPYRLHVLVNSAGVMPKGDLRTIEAAQWDATLSLNLRAPWLCARYAAQRMASGGGVIINISDAGVQRAWTGYAAYLVSKAGLEMLTRLLARSFAPAIRVNALAPGLILSSEHLADHEWQRLVERLPLKKSGDVADIVQAVMFLINNPYITGQTLVVDGGYQLV